MLPGGSIVCRVMLAYFILFLLCGFAADLVSGFADAGFAADLYESYVFKNITMVFCCTVMVV